MTFTTIFIKKIETTQRAMKRRIVEVMLINKKRNTWIRQQTGVMDVVEMITRQ